MSDTVNYDEIHEVKLDGHVKKDDPGPFSRFMKRLIKKDIHEIEEYVKEDIIKPKLADILYDTFTGALSMMLYGDGGRSGDLKSSYRSNTEYHRISKSGSATSRRDREYDRIKSDGAPGKRSTLEYDTFRFETRSDANKVLDQMRDHINRFGEIPLSVYYSFVNEKAEYTYKYYGWTDLRSATVVPAHRGGFIISLPPLVSLED